MSDEIEVCFRLNGEQLTLCASTNEILSSLLRDRLGCTSVKISCERGVCGSCTCLVDGLPVASCSVFAFDVEGTTVETVEGLYIDGNLSPVQQAFIECSGFQCGYCTPGMIMLATALLRECAQPDEDTIRSWIDSNICRCTGYQMILESVAGARDLTLAEGANP